MDLFLWPVIFPQPVLGVLLEEAGREIGMKGGRSAVWGGVLCGAAWGGV